MFGHKNGDELKYSQEDYKKIKKRNLLIILSVAVVTVLISFYTISMTEYPISFSEMIQILIDGPMELDINHYEEYVKHKIIWENYLPRVMAGVLIGGTLGVAGAVMQSIINNPLADPYVTGISSGATFGVALFIVYGITILPLSGDLGMITNAFIFALIPALIIMGMAAMGRSSSTMIILVGMGVMMVFGAASQLLMISSNPDSMEEIYMWNVGSLSLVKNINIPYLLLTTTVLCGFSMYMSKYITILTTGDKSAQTLGVNPKLVRLSCFLVISFATAMAVCFSGAIGFVGLVVPHICRILLGSSKNITALSGIVGALMLVVCDSIARLIVVGGLPVGVITAVIGSPIFLYFLVKSRKGSYYG